MEHPYWKNVGHRPQDVNTLTPWDEGYEPLQSMTRLRGFSAVERNPDYDRLVHAYLPVTGGDEHVLLAGRHRPRAGR